MSKCDADCWDFIKRHEPSTMFDGIGLQVTGHDGHYVNWLHDGQRLTTVQASRHSLTELAVEMRNYVEGRWT